LGWWFGGTSLLESLLEEAHVWYLTMRFAPIRGSFEALLQLLSLLSPVLAGLTIVYAVC
jgi:hypothetical protein